MRIVRRAEYEEMKKSFFRRHKGDFQCDDRGSSTENYHKTYNFKDGAIWYEVMTRDAVTERVEIKFCNVPVSIFIGLDSDKQTRIFTTINTTQTKVNGSLSLFLEKNDPIWTPRKMIVNIAEMFNTDLKSPLRSRIKFNVLNEEIDKESSIISLQAFGGNILDLIYDDDKDFYKVKDWNENGNDIRQLNDIDKRLLWAFYEERREDMLYKILFNYFSSIRDAFPEEWKDKKSILVKTTGYNAFMYVFQYLCKKGLEKGDLSKEFFDQYMCKIKKMKGSFNTNVFGGSGLQESNRLAMVIMNQMGLFDEEMKNLNS